MKNLADMTERVRAVIWALPMVLATLRAVLRCFLTRRVVEVRESVSVLRRECVVGGRMEIKSEREARRCLLGEAKR